MSHEPTADDLTYAKSRQQAALWYAWGQQDAGTGRHVDAWTFAGHHYDKALAYRTEQRGWLPSVTDAWATYCAEQVTR